MFMPCIILNIFYLFSHVICDRILDKTYLNVLNSSVCFKILNGSTEVGCQSDIDGNVGVIHLVESQKDIEYMEEDKHRKGSFIAVFPLKKNFQPALMLKTKDMSSVTGLILTFRSNNSEFRPPRYSDDRSCPNPKSGLYESCKEWNIDAEGLWFQSWKKPIFLVTNDTEVTMVEECYGFNGARVGYPYCASHLTSLMMGAGDAERCIRRNSLFGGISSTGTITNCDMLRGESAYSFVPPISKTIKDYKTYVIAARLDSLTMFSGTSPAVSSVYATLALFYAVAQTIGSRMHEINKLTNSRTLLFSLFNGEALDYSGSSRVVYDMEKGNFPNSADYPKFTVDNIKVFVELGQMANPHSTSYYIHHDTSLGDAASKASLNSLVNEFVNDTSTNQFVKLKSAPGDLPPSSVQKFLQKKKFPAIVISDSKDHFNNRYFHSSLDTVEMLEVTRKDLLDKFEELVNVIAKQAYHWVTDNSTLIAPLANKKKLTQLLDCFVFKPKCKLFRNLFDSFTEKEKSSNPQQFYDDAFDIPFKGYMNPNTKSSQLSGIVSPKLLSFVLSEDLGIANVNGSCDKKINNSRKQYTIERFSDWFGTTNSSFCGLHTTRKHSAQSPAFEIDDYDFASGNYPTWIESHWTNVEIRLFLKSDPIWCWGVFCLGVLVLGVSLLATWIATKNANLLFQPNV